MADLPQQFQLPPVNKVQLDVIGLSVSLVVANMTGRVTEVLELRSTILRLAEETGHEKMADEMQGVIDIVAKIQGMVICPICDNYHDVPGKNPHA